MSQRVEMRDGYEWRTQICPICEVPPSKFVGRRGGAAHRAGLGVECRIWRCKRCDLVFPNPMPVPVNGTEQQYALDPDAYFHRHDSARRLEGARALLRQGEDLVGRKGRLLDIGSGRGEILLAAREAGWDAVGIEPSPSFAEHAERASGATIMREPLERCHFESASFDIVFLAAVLEHIYNPDETIREIARVLRPGGGLFLDVPNERGLYFRVGNLYQRLRGRDWSVNLAPTFEPFHVFGYSPSSLRALLAKHGLRIQYWHVYPGEAMLDDSNTKVGKVEQLAARAVTAASKLGELGTYIETWAIRQ